MLKSIASKLRLLLKIAMLQFDDNGGDDYLFWQKTEKNKLKRINDLIKECRRTPFERRGKPESLKGNLSGFWSRRIDDEHRLVYSYNNDTLTIIACRYLY